MQATSDNLKLKQAFSTPEYNSCINCHWKRLFFLIPKMLKAQDPLLTKPCMKNTLLADGNVPIHAPLFMPPSQRQEGICKRRSFVLI